MFGLFMWQGWFQKWFAFYVEHFISNFNWLVYFASANALMAAALTQNDLASWTSFLGYSIFAFGMWKAEYDYGTQAIRFLNNDYYADPKLMPSILYLLGVIQHQEKVQYDFESDPSQVDDIPIDIFTTVDI